MDKVQQKKKEGIGEEKNKRVGWEEILREVRVTVCIAPVF